MQVDVDEHLNIISWRRRLAAKRGEDDDDGGGGVMDI